MSEEQRHAKEFAIHLRENLKADILLIDRIVSFREQQVKYMIPWKIY